MTHLKMTTCLAFDHQAEEAVNFYTATLPDARILAITRCGENEPGGPPGSVRTVEFEMVGQTFLAINGGPYFKFSDAISLMISCETQSEIDALWEKLSEGGVKVQCGWLKDRYGVSWQIVPSVLSRMLLDEDQQRAQRVMQALLKMQKIEISGLQVAFENP